MEEELEHTSLGVGKPLVLTPIATEDHGSKRKTLRGLRIRIWVEQERYLCDGKTYKPGLLKVIPTEAEVPKQHFKASVSPLPLDIIPAQSALFIPTYLGAMLLSPFLHIPGLLFLLKKGNQVQLRDSKTCLLKKKEHDSYPRFYNFQPSTVFNREDRPL